VPFADVYDPHKKLLRDFGPPRKSYHPEYSFWHLQSDGLWVIPERAALDRDLAERESSDRKMSKPERPNRTKLRKIPLAPIQRGPCQR
jgi:predicted restriction endonuclease